MLITFRSRSSGDVIMLENDGRAMLRLFGKGADESKGIVTVDQIPLAIAAVKKAVDEEREMTAKALSSEIDVDAGTDEVVHLFQRAQPILELLERSLLDGAPVTWGV